MSSNHTKLEIHLLALRDAVDFALVRFERFKVEAPTCKTILN